MTLDLDMITNPQAFVDRLANHGVSLPAIDKWKALSKELGHHLPEPDEPTDVLNRSVEELRDYVSRARFRELAHEKEGIHRHTQRMHELLVADLRAQLREAASKIIATLRPEFDKSADIMRNAVKLGITPDSTMTSLFEADKPVRTAWLTLPRHAKILDGILTTRQQLSWVAQVPPVVERHGLVLTPQTIGVRDQTSSIDWGITVTRNGSLRTRDDKAPWSRWLAAADDLELIDPADWGEGFELLEVTNPREAAALRAAANTR